MFGWKSIRVRHVLASSTCFNWPEQDGQQAWFWAAGLLVPAGTCAIAAVWDWSRRPSRVKSAAVSAGCRVLPVAFE
jgi:hypothetical protein